ncbi:MAG: L-lactate dehydrogenase [Ruminococcaceae bacterium]|nr:L-lactate dehydrogenase [Oscillospiraceae bacterium]
MSKITIIGAGSVGATIAYTLSTESIATEIVMIDINKKKAGGEVMDIMQGTSFRDAISITSGDYEDAKGSDLVIITSGVPRAPGQSRIDLAQTNVNIIKEIAPRIAKAAPDALYIIVSNPVDIITYVFMKKSGLPERQILGSGTLLDTSRLRYALAEHFGVAQKSIHAYIFGEHGDTSFVPWSCARISAVGVEEYTKIAKECGDNLPPMDTEMIEERVRKSGGLIIEGKGATYYAVAMAVCRLCSILLAPKTSIVTVSSMMHGEYDLEDVCLSTLTRIGVSGVISKFPVPLNEEEYKKLHHSANTLKNVISQLDLA